MAAASPSDDSPHDRELPTPEDRISDFYAEFSDLAALPISHEPGTSLRREYVVENWSSWESEPTTEYEDAVSGESRESVKPLSWGRAVETLLESYEDTRQTTVNLEKGVPSDPEYTEWSVEAETRWMASYQRTYYAQLEAWMRELTGGERPSGGETEGTFDDPHVVLLTRSASSKPSDDRLAPADHWNSIGDVWSGAVYDTLRNVLRSKGYNIGDDWQYERRLEPHTSKRGDGRGVNQCYCHEHVVIVVDGEVEPEQFRPVMEKHVEACEYAAMDAHRNVPCPDHADGNGWNDAVGGCSDCQTSVVVHQPDELDANVAQYVASYAGIEPTGLLERPTDYIAWAAVMDATNTRTKSRSDAAKHAAKADACKQRAESPKSEQESDHGSSVVRSTRRGYDYECKHCGSPHGIDQSPETLTAARRDGTPVAADGGIDRTEELRSRWQDARAAASVGESRERCRQRRRVETYISNHPDVSNAEILQQLRQDLPDDLDAARSLITEVRAGVDPSEPVGFERVPQWRVKSVEIRDEEYPASAGNGVEMVEIDTWRHRARSQMFKGRVIEETDETIEYVYRRFQRGLMVKCSVTGDEVDAGNGHLVVKTDAGRHLIVEDIPALQQWVV